MNLFIDDPTPTSGPPGLAGRLVIPQEIRFPDELDTPVPPIGCPKCGTILNAAAADCPGPWHAANQPDPNHWSAWPGALSGVNPEPCLPVDDPTPTTGGPVEYEFPEGCTCHIREYTDVGDQRHAPPEGCRIHTPWAFPGYSLADEGAWRPAQPGDTPGQADPGDDPLAPLVAGLGPCDEGCECRGAP